MTITFLDLYNAVSSQAWSMFDADAESREDFETAMSTSIQKALSELWCSYNFPFRIKTKTIKTRENKNVYSAPDGNIIKRVVKGKSIYCVKLGNKYLDYIDEHEIQDDKTGEPKYFYSDGNNIIFYPYPDDAYTITVEYATIAIGYDENDNVIYTLEKDKDRIDIPAKYETIFKNALITKAMVYVIASRQDENYEGYEEQYNNAYKVLIKYCSGGVERDKRIVI